MFVFVNSFILNRKYRADYATTDVHRQMYITDVHARSQSKRARQMYHIGFWGLKRNKEHSILINIHEGRLQF